MNYSRRRQKAVDLLTQLKLDALVLCHPENIRYLCGFTGSDGALIVSTEQLVFLTDSRYTTQARSEVVADKIDEYRVKGDGVIAVLTSLVVERIGFEVSLAVGVFNDLRDKGSSGWVWQHLHDEIQSLRLRKSADEIQLISTAAGLNLAGFTEIRPMLRPGVRETEISLALEFAMRKLGAEEKAFDIIVASGERGAMPHGVASDKLLAEGELVTIDFGCRCAGYHSDETVTLAVGDVSDELRRIYDTVLEAHDRALAAVAPGIALSELDRIARDYISTCGYAEYFGHGLGHGIGLEVHEGPVVSSRSKAVADVGMVFTVEPGIYVPGVGGVRIEDMVLVTAEGHRVLTKIPKTFQNILLR
ncbi:MAG: aminopeptidase P family protein [Deltaproteobacteria bacterium]|jgi:Xaa-Pro aminopeptidase|nr:aminopeptidase P family protein [Deltaproteobacteria bacterium]